MKVPRPPIVALANAVLARQDYRDQRQFLDKFMTAVRFEMARIQAQLAGTAPPIPLRKTTK